MTCGIVQLATPQFKIKLHKNVDTHLGDFSFVVLNRRIHVLKSRAKAPLACRRKTKFPTVYPTMYLTK